MKYCILLQSDCAFVHLFVVVKRLLILTIVWIVQMNLCATSVIPWSYIVEQNYFNFTLKSADKNCVADVVAFMLHS